VCLVAVKELRDEYLSADSVHRKYLEQRYGRKNIQKLVEDSFSEDWLSSNAKKCPQCAAHIEVSLSSVHSLLLNHTVTQNIHRCDSKTYHFTVAHDFVNCRLIVTSC